MNPTVALLLASSVFSAQAQKRSSVCGDGYVEIYRQCMDEAFRQNNYVVCSDCICLDMGGACDVYGEQHLYDCEVTVRNLDTELACRLALKFSWLTSFCFLAVLFGLLMAFITYTIYIRGKCPNFCYTFNFLPPELKKLQRRRKEIVETTEAASGFEPGLFTPEMAPVVV